MFEAVQYSLHTPGRVLDATYRLDGTAARLLWSFRFWPVAAVAKAGDVRLRRFRFRQKRCADSPCVFCTHRGRRVASVKRGFQSACERAGIEDCTPHTLRHTAAAWMTQSGVPMRVIAGVLRHKDLRTTMRYSHLSGSALWDGVQTLSRLRHVEGNEKEEESVSA